MKKPLILIVFLVLILATITWSSFLRDKAFPPDFNFIFEYGVMNKNVLNTFDETYTKDLVMEETVTISLKLTQDEKKEIYEYMKSIHLFNYPNENVGMMMKPTSGYRFDIQHKGRRLTINWFGEFNDTERDQEFRGLTRYVIDIIETKEAYKSLPAARGGYL